MCKPRRGSQELAANAGSQQWDYCVPKPNYAEVRARVGSAFAEKAHELADAVAVVQGLSKEATRLPWGVLRHFLALSFIVRLAAGEIISISWERPPLSMIFLMCGFCVVQVAG